MIKNKTDSANGITMNSTLYQQELFDHYRYPRNYGILDKPDIASQLFNPSCGDAVSITACITNNIITAIKFQGQGCVISQASTSLLTEKILNQPVLRLQEITKDDMLALVGIPLGPTRLRCALLGLEALNQAVNEYKKKS